MSELRLRSALRPSVSLPSLLAFSLVGIALAGGCSDDDPSGSGTAGSGGSSMAGSAGSMAGNGTSGSGMAGSGMQAGASCDGLLFCDDFESFPAGAPPGGDWGAQQTNGSVTVDTERAFSGQSSVKATTLSTAASGSTYKAAFINLSTAVFPREDNAVYGRMMFYLESAPLANVHWTIVDATGDIAGEDYSATYRYGGQLPIPEGGPFTGNQLMANYDTVDFYGTPSVGPNTDCYRHANGTPVPVGSWTCAEWFFDGQANAMRFWLDGEEISAIAIDGTGDGCVAQPADYTWTAPSFSRIDVGWESYQEDDERTIWIDDVAIGTERIGCPAAP